jgi:hypothetical protein
MSDVDAYCASSIAGGLMEGVDPRASVPDICREARQTVVDQIRGNRPTTVLGLLVETKGPIALDAIANLLGKDREEVEWTAEVLEEGGLCARLFEQDRVFVSPFAPYSVEGESVPDLLG